MTVADIFNEHKISVTVIAKSDYVCSEAERNVADALSDYLDKADLDITQACKTQRSVTMLQLRLTLIL